MAQVKEFELLHGIVLAKILRSEGASLRLVETDTKNAWAAYKINDEVIVYVKYALTKRRTKKEGKLVWSFQFQSADTKKLVQLRAEKPVYTALVCGVTDIKSAKEMQICLLDPEQIDKCIDVNVVVVQTISVEYKPGTSLRAYGPSNAEERKKLVISRGKLDEWKIPGS